MRINNDIETALYSLLHGDGYSSSAHMIPATLGNNLPHIHVVRTGGFTSDMVIESHAVDFDVYDDDAADAMGTAATICNWVRGLPGRNIGTCYAAEVTTLPYNNPDPRHPTLGRATIKAQILTRTKEE